MNIGRKRLNEINLIKEKNIDYSDIPELDKEFWDNAMQVYTREKKAISIRLDQDIIDFFKKEGRGYQSKINSVLRSYIEAHHS